MAADAHSKIAIPSLSDKHFRHSGNPQQEHLSETIARWASLSRVKSVKDLERRASTSTQTVCKACHQDFLDDKIKVFKETLDSLPPVVMFCS